MKQGAEQTKQNIKGKTIFGTFVFGKNDEACRLRMWWKQCSILKAHESYYVALE